MAAVTALVDQWADGQGFVKWTYDDATLALQSFTSQNLTPKPCRITITDPSQVTRTVSIPANQAQTTQGVSAFGITLHRYTLKDGSTNVSFPPGWSVSFGN